MEVLLAFTILFAGASWGILRTRVGLALQAIREDEDVAEAQAVSTVPCKVMTYALAGAAAAGTLSGGERQMLAIAGGLMSHPRLLTLDEPSVGLAPAVVLLLYEVVRKLNRHGLKILLVEQNVQHAIELAERTFVLEGGRIALSGGGELKDNDEVRRAYLGL